MTKPTPVLDRLAAKTDATDPDQCWEWTGYIASTGYGRITVDGRSQNTHRYVYEFLVGPIPDGLHLDHLCRNRACVNPDHLEPVTNRENWRRGDHPAAIVHRTGKCKHGHSMEDAYVTASTGWRMCRTCKLEYLRRRKANAKAAGS